MSIFDKLNPIKAIVSTVGGIIDNIHTSDEEKLELKNALWEARKEFEMAALQAEVDIAKEKASIVREEIRSKHWLAANWRPLLMLVFILILFNNYIIAPYVPSAQVLEFPTAFWSLMTVGVGGYIGARTYEKKLDIEAE